MVSPSRRHNFYKMKLKSRYNTSDMIKNFIKFVVVITYKLFNVKHIYRILIVDKLL